MLDNSVCQCCNGAGVLNNGLDRPLAACSNCHGSGKYTYEVPHDYSKSVVDRLKCIDLIINSPPHYTFGTIEVITVIDDWQLGFYEGNCVKYIGRAKHKGNELQDLKKAQWYLNRRIGMLMNQDKEK